MPEPSSWSWQGVHLRNAIVYMTAAFVVGFVVGKVT